MILKTTKTSYNNQLQKTCAIQQHNPIKDVD